MEKPEKPSRFSTDNETSTIIAIRAPFTSTSYFKDAQKKRGIDTCIQLNPHSSKDFEESLECKDSNHLDGSITPLSGDTWIITTKKYQIFRVSTPAGIRVLKLLRPESFCDRNINALDNELEVSNKVSHHSLRKCFAKTTYQGRKSLLLEWVPGIPICDVGKLNIPNFLKVARDIVSILLKLHDNNIFHMNLSCDHILFNPESKSVTVIGCGLSTTFSSKKSYVCSNELLERDLRFISPEQTGRINREVDHRSDFYSLGIIFYKLLSGRHPFDSKDKSKLIQMHVLKDLSPLHMDDENIPIPISKMISKLLRKSPDERYQSTKGVIYDIDLFMSEYQSATKLSISTEIAQHDMSDSLLIPQKLYGRSTECKTLLTVKNRIAKSATFELVFVTGSSGTGKSALVLEMLKSMAPNDAFICGKHDFSRSKAYSALIEAIQIFCDNLLLKDELEIKKYRSLILGAVGEEGRLLTNIIDNLHLIIGEQSELSDNFSHETKHKFNYVFINFIKAIASVSNPLVLVLEDLQWLDIASIDLLKALLKSQIKNLMFIGVYRDNDVCDAYQLAEFLKFVKEIDISPTNITLENMDYESTNELISDALCVSPLESYSLTTFVQGRTKGNPFFVKHMLRSLFEKEKITFNHEKRKWQWDDCTNETKGIAENVIGLLRHKIQSFDMHTQQTLAVATCLGSRSSLSFLRKIMNNKEGDEGLKGVEGALSSGMLTHCKRNDTYFFAHDLVQHAAKSFLPKDPKPIYLHIARKLVKMFSEVELNDNICLIAHLHYRAKDLIHDDERLNIAELFEMAGEKEMTATAFDEAFKYFESGVALLGPDCWKVQYNLSVKLHCNAARAAYCMAKFENIKEYIEKLFANATRLTDVIPAYVTLVQFYCYKNNHKEAVTTAIGVLNKLGESINLKHNDSLAELEILKTKSLVGNSFQQVLNIEVIKDSKGIIRVMEFFSLILLSAYHVDIRLYIVISSRMIQLTLKHGISKYSCLGFASFGVVLAGNKDKAAYDYGQLSLQLVEKVKVKELVPIVNVCFYANIYHWYASVHHSVDIFRNMTRASLENGSHLHSIVCSEIFFQRAFWCGKPLLLLKEDIQDLRSILPRKTSMLQCMHQATCNLLDGNENNPAILYGKDFDCRMFLKNEKKGFDIAIVSVIASFLAFLFHDFDTALEMIEISKSMKKRFPPSTYLWPIFYLYEGLISLSFARRGVEIEKWSEKAKQNIMKLRDLCHDAPENFQNKYHLLEAELAAVQNNKAQAIFHYKKAICLSKKNNFVHEEALACERAGIFYLELDSQEATALLLQSYRSYKIWGATSKINHLLQNYPFLNDKVDNPTIELCVTGEELRVGNSSQDSVSLLSDDESSLNLWEKQKRIRYSTNKKDGTK